MILKVLTFFLAALWAGPAVAEPPMLAFPLVCELGKDCFIQQYVDRDPTSGAQDYMCRGLSYDTHRGTDIRIAFRKDIYDPGIPVFAAAAGVVRGVRNGEADIAQGSKNAPDISGKECGNGVVLEHADGWRTQYCHLRNNSIVVRPGQSIAEGQLLGRIGLSGETEFPHVHFKLSYGERVVDPFDADEAPNCGPEATPISLWQKTPTYQPGGLMAAGFSPVVLDFEAIREGPEMIETLPIDSPAIVFWGYFFGLRKGDEIWIEVFDPERGFLTGRVMPVTRNRAEAFRLIGKKNTGEGFAPGKYLGQIQIKRDGETLAVHRRDLIVK